MTKTANAVHEHVMMPQAFFYQLLVYDITHLHQTQIVWKPKSLKGLGYTPWLVDLQVTIYKNEKRCMYKRIK